MVCRVMRRVVPLRLHDRNGARSCEPDWELDSISGPLTAGQVRELSGIVPSMCCWRISRRPALRCVYVQADDVQNYQADDEHDYPVHCPCHERHPGHAQHTDRGRQPEDGAEAELWTGHGAILANVGPVSMFSIFPFAPIQPCTAESGFVSRRLLRQHNMAR